MHRLAALTVLDLPETAGEQDIRVAYAQRLRAIHPDKGETVHVNVAEEIRTLQQAKQCLLGDFIKHQPVFFGDPEPPLWQGGSLDVPFFVQMHPVKMRKPVSSDPKLAPGTPRRPCCFPGCTAMVGIAKGTPPGPVCCVEHTHVRYASVVGFKRPEVSHERCSFCDELALFDDTVCRRHLYRGQNMPINHPDCQEPGCSYRAISRKAAFCYRHSQLNKSPLPKQ